MSLLDVYSRYRTAFGELPPLMLWTRDDDDELEALMEKAILRGDAITETELLAAQGKPPLREGALY